MTGEAEPLGLIAGEGRLPVLIAQGVRRARRRLIVAAFRGRADPALRELADAFAWVSMTRIGSWIRILRRHRVHSAILAGAVRKTEIYSPLRLLRYLPDFRTARLWFTRLRHDKRDNTVLKAVAEELAREGIELMSSVEYCREHLASEGLMTKTPLPRSVEEDVVFGFRIARKSAELDVGQSIAVREGDIIAVEAMEGTDQMIERAGRLCPTGGWTLVKVARPDQDMRFDVPTVGADTIKRLKQAGCVCLILEADKTVILDKTATLELADRCRIAVMGKRT